MSHNRDSLHTLNHRSNTLLQKIVDNTDTLEVSVDNIEVDMAGVETLLTTANNATLRDINNTGSIGDGSSNSTSISLGYDRTNGKGRAILVDSGGSQSVVIKGNTSGDGSGDSHHLHIDSNGIAKTQVVNAPSIIPHSTLDASATDDPSTSLSSTLKGRTTITDSSTGKFLLCDADGHLQVDLVSGGFSSTGLATSALQTTGNTSLATIAGDTTSIDGKITACNTGAVVVSSSALPTGGATSALQTTGNTSLATIATDTTSIDGKITACNTGAVVVSSSALPTGGATSALQTTGNTSLATIAGDTTSIDGKITACNTGAVVVSSSALPSGGATSALQTTGNTSLSTIAGDTTSLDGKVNQGYDATVSSGGSGLQQVLAYGRDSGGNLDALSVDNNGHLQIVNKVHDVENKGSEGNVLSNNSLGNNTATSSIDISDFNKVNFMYEDNNTSNSNGIRVEVSEDNSKFYIHSEFFPVNYGSVRQYVSNPALDLSGIKRVRFNNHNTGAANDLTNVHLTVLGTPN
jgi:hypothetical protein